MSSAADAGGGADVSTQVWREVVDVELPTFGELVSELADEAGISPDDADEIVDQAIADGTLIPDGESVFGATYEVRSTVRVAKPIQIRVDTNTTNVDVTNANDDDSALDALAVAIEFYHEQLDRELPAETEDGTPIPYDTAREYFTDDDGRGWDEGTVDRQLLGYAPPGGTGLLDRLMRESFDRDAILGTGLFYESLDPHFRGRFVFPYFDEDGRPVYTISRSIDEHHGGHPADPKGGQKYTKAIKTADYSHVDEPIFGLGSVDQNTDRLLVVGGVADAIALHAAGYACISPVTTVRFKKRHEQPVLDLIEQYDISRVYIINDAERPSVSEVERNGDVERIRDALTIEEVGEGRRGAFGNAEFLHETNTDAEVYFVDLPAGDDDRDKLDPDEYLSDNWGSVEPLLASAKPARQDRHYQAWIDDDQAQARELADASRTMSSTRAQGSVGANRSALFDLDITDVTGLNEGYRGTNPLGHHGESEDYYVIIEHKGALLAYDHKYRVAYNALTYLLCDAGERRADRPNGSITDREMLAAWIHAKREGHIASDDPVPHHALRHVALDAGLCDQDEIADGWRLPADAYNKALDALREEYDIEPGKEPLSDNGKTADPSRWCEECEPPLSADADPLDVDARREAMTGELFDAFVGRDGLSGWAHNPGEGKTTSAAIAAADRDRDHVVALPKHENCREFQRDETKPDGYFHLKGAAQPVGDQCMDTAIADDDECPEHEHPSNCPTMCPIYSELDSDHPIRVLFDVLAGSVGVQQAHVILDLDKKSWHDDKCEWQKQWDRIESEVRIVTVHNYLSMKSVREHGDIIIDDLQGALIDEETVGLQELSRCRDAIKSFAEYADDDRTMETLRKLARVLDETLETLSESSPGEAGLDDIESPTFPFRYSRTFGRREDIPDDTRDEAIEQRRERRYVGEGGQYVYDEVYRADIVDPAEALAQAKRMYVDTLLERIRRGKWSETPVDLDPVLAVLDAAGGPSRACRIAAGTPTVLDHCPRCNGRLGSKDGARMCTDGSCGWSEADDHLTDEESTPARIDALPATSESGVHGITIRRLPPVDQLPDPSNVLVLNATLRKAEVAALFGTDAENVIVDGDDPYALPHATVTQITDGAYHRRTFETSETAVDRAQRAIDRIHDMHDDVIYVTLKKAEGRFDWPDDAEVLNYYALRGLDRDADAVVCVGAPHPDEDALRADARVLAADHSELRVGGRELSTRRNTDAPVYRKLNYVDDEERGRAIASKTYSGLVGELFDARHADEIEQAAHRNRPILADEDNERHVYLLTNVATNLPVDRLTAYDQLLDPTEHHVDVPDSARALLDAAIKAADDPDLDIDYGGDGSGTYSIRGTGPEWEAAGAASDRDTLAISGRAIRDALSELRETGLVVEGPYIQRRGRVYTLTELGARVASSH